jgi:hypothetical protein
MATLHLGFYALIGIRVIAGLLFVVLVGDRKRTSVNLGYNRKEMKLNQFAKPISPQ